MINHRNNLVADITEMLRLPKGKATKGYFTKDQLVHLWAYVKQQRERTSQDAEEIQEESVPGKSE